MLVNQPPINIFIVDDSVEDREVYRRYINSRANFEYKILEAESGESGLAKLEGCTPDLILLDYLLPDFNGLEFISELQSLIGSIPPIVMLTGQGSEGVAVEAMKRGVKDYLVKGTLTPEILVGSITNVLQQHRLKKLLSKNQQQQRLIAETALRIRQTLDLSEILNIAVQEVRLLLKCDRVIIYRFASDMSGDVVAESVETGWKRSLGQKVIDTCFQQGSAAKYKRGETKAIDNVYEAGFTECHLSLLEEFQVEASIIVPILLIPSTDRNDSRLWGLLIAHQCSNPRQWQTDEVELLDKLAVQLSLAIQQAELIANLRSELKTRKKLEAELERLVGVLEASEDYIGLADVTGKMIWKQSPDRADCGTRSR